MTVVHVKKAVCETHNGFLMVTIKARVIQTVSLRTPEG